MIGENDLPGLTSDNDGNTVSKEVGNDAEDRSIKRKVTPDSYKDSITRDGILYWDNDPATLRDYANNVVVRTFIDTKARDVAKQDWQISVGDEEIDEEAEKFLRYAHPSKSWQDLVEATSRNLDILGNSFWVVHFYENKDEPAEIIDPNPATMFIEKDEDGFIKNYVHNPVDGSPTAIPPEQVLHFKLKSDTSTTYSNSFVSDSTDIIEILDEIERKEALNLKKASQSGMLTQTDTHPTDPLTGEQWGDLVDYVTDTNQGKTHQISVAKGEFEFIPFEGKYKDLELRDRYKLWIAALGAQFGVNPSYVGFDFENVNRATDESQRQSYKERGIQTIMANIESKINHKLIPHIAEDERAKFKWQTKEQDELDEVEYYERLGNAVQAIEEAGLSAEVTDDDKINIVDMPDVDENEEVPEQESEPVQEPEKLEECVESILEENADITESEAYAICNDEIEKSDVKGHVTDDKSGLSERKQEFMEAVPFRSFKDALVWLDSTFDARTDAYEWADSMLDGSLSKSTYYNWLEECDLK
jgi:phage portal protein BeeE